MPELPEVERAAALLRSVGIGKTIRHVDATEDAIVFSNVSHEEFAKEITGRTLKGATRYGKYFFMDLNGVGRMPVLHFGMTGMVQVRGQPTPQYRKKVEDSDDWPPRFVKFVLHLHDEESDTTTELAFSDPRRLGRIRLVASPLAEAPIADLGFDPILSMPPFGDFKKSVLKRSCPIKALLLDQSFSAGVGNYLADEILYQSRVHPEQRCNTLGQEQLASLHHEIADVCRITVAVNADDDKYPEHWLFKHRWGKGKKIAHTMKLPTGESATIKWITVGGRTSAYVAQLQQLHKAPAPGKTASQPDS
ncbi:Formamidopyrimidine-DNA glycosylase N-terminal domain-containing protein [Hygrophoropsis aurantiaca]|uniref:Formamidopyrimidine-DNA glycosylase N-terminal domain-containing protein n=1 Tax=Hygrophoropsis aurantiaca TaxID=72124 RepID=A0ACB8AN75_9AGAM|nr:Formamidopyrimidine-DNA glycosylase N-terminal domain-containing protein [Hygrophoropsis aurantiaca]